MKIYIGTYVAKSFHNTCAINSKGVSANCTSKTARLASRTLTRLSHASAFKGEDNHPVASNPLASMVSPCATP